METARPLEITHIYCDESCHLETDHLGSMVLGAISCPTDQQRRIVRCIKDLKREHGILQGREIKWGQVSPATLKFYLALVELFFAEPELGFRGVVVPEKSILDHEAHSQSHDDFYYKLWYLLLTRMVDDQRAFRVFFDIKDTHSATKLGKLHQILCSTHYDFDCSRIRSIEPVRSHDVYLVQLADVLTGALSHAFRGLHGSLAKQAVLAYIRQLSGLTLAKSTPPGVKKFNLFVWQPRASLHS